jgi:hypothetical protein
MNDEKLQGAKEVNVYIDMSYVSRYIRATGGVFNIFEIKNHFKEINPSSNVVAVFTFDSEDAQTRTQKAVEQLSGFVFTVVNADASTVAKVTGDRNLKNFALTLLMGKKTWGQGGHSKVNIFITDDPNIFNLLLNVIPPFFTSNFVVGPDVWSATSALRWTRTTVLSMESFIELTGANKEINIDGTAWVPLE